MDLIFCTSAEDCKGKPMREECIYSRLYKILLRYIENNSVECFHFPQQTLGDGSMKCNFLWRLDEDPQKFCIDFSGIAQLIHSPSVIKSND